jgi:2-methylisocitrate lyase-like PEP mutase family enzyme
MTAHEKRIRLKELMMAPGCTPAVGVYDAISAKVVERTGFDVRILAAILQLQAYWVFRTSVS